MNLSTINNSTVTLAPSGGGSNIQGVITFHGNNRVLFDPTPLLAEGTSYMLTVATGVLNAAGTQLAAPFTATFTTVAPVDNTDPTVSAVIPASGAGGVATDSQVKVTFSEPMDGSTIIAANVGLSVTGGGAVAGTLAFDGDTNTATFTPSAALANGTSFTVSVSTAAADVAGNSLASTFTSSFTTAAPPDVTAPAVTSASPADRASEVKVTSTVRVTFDEPIDPSTLTESRFTVREISGTGVSISGTRTYDAATNTAIFTPSAPLKNYRNYTVTIAPGVSDIAGNLTSSQYSSCFTPTAGAGVAATLERDHWAGNDACIEVHWHIPLARWGMSLPALQVAEPTISTATSPH